MDLINWSDILDRYAATAPARLSDNAVTVLGRRYLQRGPDGEPIEEPADMFRRVAGNIAEAEIAFGNAECAEPVARAFFGLLSSLDFLPNSPTLMNAGRKLQQLAACFVLPVEDSIEGIFETLKATALIHQSGGGTGFSFSRLRPRGDYVTTSQGQASGPVSFMRVYNEATRAISQGGFRRGANMAVLRIDHPDIAEFIACKEDEGAFENFNISVAVTGAFMDALAHGRAFPLINPRGGATSAEVDPEQLWEEIVNRAWANGEPGALFLDRANTTNPTPELGAIESTNPCGEQPLLPNEACNLGSINLSHFIAGPDDGDAARRLDLERLRGTVHLAVRFLDNTIEMSRYPLPAITETVRGNRKVGLGVMGWADALIELGIPYDSEATLELGRRVMSVVAEEADRASRDLGRQRGGFPNIARSVFADEPGPPRRNATVTTVAPTGTLSLLAECSPGIEPVFSMAHERHVLGGERLAEVQPAFERLARRRGFFSEGLMDRLTYQAPREIPELPEDVRRLFATALTIDPAWHVRMQAAFQEHVDNAVSKTVNLPRASEPSDVDRVYRMAYELGCKGITVYRDQSRREQVLVRQNGRVMVAPETVSEGSVACPECGEPLQPERACTLCPSCGYTRC